MRFKITLTDTAYAQIHDLEFNEDQKDLAELKKVNKCLGYLQANPAHRCLSTHEYSSVTGENGEKVWGAHVENKTPSAWRVFWHCGPDRNEITIVAITTHP